MNRYRLLKILKKIAEVNVGMTKFLLDNKKIATHVNNTINLNNISESPKTPAGKIIILPSRAASVEYATQLNHWNIFEFTLTFFEVTAPINRDIKVASDVAIIARMIILLVPIFISE